MAQVYKADYLQTLLLFKGLYCQLDDLSKLDTQAWKCWV